MPEPSEVAPPPTGSALAGNVVPPGEDFAAMGVEVDDFGASLRPTCAACGSELPPAAHFCPSCGRLVTQVNEERRIATVLFADIVGFTTLSEGRDPETVKRLVDGCLRALVADVAAYGGTVDKLLGDAVLALFGAPVAHGDDAERAVRAALQLHQTLARYVAEQLPHLGSELAAELGANPLELRVGINTGEVLTGALHAGGDYTAMGDVVNIAQRLQSEAAPGEVLVGSLTHDITSRSIQYEELPALVLKGRSGKVPTWRAVGAAAPPGRRHSGAVTPLVGREREIDLLTAFVELVRTQNRAGLVMLMGDSGLGKTRLAEEVAARAASDVGARVLEGRCVPYGEANVWWPAAEAIMELAGTSEADPPEQQYARMVRLAVRALDVKPEDREVRRCVSGLRYILGDDTALRSLEPARARDEGMRAIEMCIAGVARRQPVVLIASDMHWADQLVIDLLNRLLDRLRNLPFVVLTTSRAPVTGLSPDNSTLTVRLDPLGRAESDELVAALLGRDDPPEVLAALLFERSGGSPLFLEELVGYWNESGVDLGAAAHPSFDARVGDLPVTLRGVVAARLDGLDSRARTGVEDAAILGRSASVAALKFMSAAHGELEANEVIDHLVDKSLLVLDDQDEWRFRSDVLREVAYDTLTKADRARRHYRAASWYESQPGHGWEQQRLELLSGHYATAAELSGEVGGIDGLPAGLRTRAIDALYMAAAAASVRDMWAVTRRLVDRALDLLPDRPREVELRLELARAHAAAHNLPAARAQLDRVMALDPDSRARADALTTMGDVLRREGDLESAMRTLENALDMWGALGDTAGAALALRHMGMTLIFQGNHQAAETAIRAALAEYEAAGDERGQGWALQNLAWTSFARGDTDEAERWVERSAEKFGELGDFGGLGWAMGLLGWIRFFQGRLEEANDIVESLSATVGQFSDLWAEGMLYVLSASVRLWQGDTTTALSRAQLAVSTMESIGDEWGLSQALAVTARAFVCMGRVNEGRSALSRLQMLPKSTSGAPGSEIGQLAAAAIEVQLGDGAAALGVLAASSPSGYSGAEEFGASRILALVLTGQIEEAVTESERFARASDHLSSQYLAVARSFAMAASGQLSDIDSALAGVGSGSYLDQAMAAILRGLLAAREGHAASSQEAFDAAIARIDQTTARLDQAVVRLGQAVAAARLGLPGASEVMAAALARMEMIDVDPTGWFTTFTQLVAS